MFLLGEAYLEDKPSLSNTNLFTIEYFGFEDISKVIFRYSEISPKAEPNNRDILNL